MAAEAQKNQCKGCKQESPLSGTEKFLLEGEKCCSENCERCKLKNCGDEKKCQCHICTCGCQDEKNKGKSCKNSSCVACRVICKQLKDDARCRCTFCDCGCENALKKGKLCSDKKFSSCDKCEKKCGKSKDGSCICYLCSCGCNGVNCQCCERCNPETKCEGKDTCDTEEQHDKTTCPKGMCKEKAGSCFQVTCMCKDLGIEKRDDVCECLCKCQKKCPRITCPKLSGGACPRPGTNGRCGCDCTCSCNACGKYYDGNGKLVDVCGNDAAMRFYAIGKCRFKCTNCGRLCDQDRCMNWIRVIVIGLIILASLFVLRAIFPEKFRAIMTKIRATFASSPVHSGRSLNNLVGHRIPEETNVDRYPAFRPRAYAGLS
ncbi:hypothetical protein BBBOND_0103090 [Babesia bigemina]|uniref:Uncharacterized protein n=1 Tax=Babesia bigemina TaxID=5866 RepID=A0A061D1J0_BABBI|nr:hypothetical protein BBBOND_0103090 [Babesia bigemina]CDR93987.1 hypothetical protein BBBOND_0103090 [Babesia bigemina]|eukprot:XP_012766173.1 hypothetical protein BBBOND_0103090 [Babesia bigemina]